MNVRMTGFQVKVFCQLWLYCGNDLQV